MSYITKLSRYGHGSLALREGHDLAAILRDFERLTRAERWRVKHYCESFAGPQPKRLEMGEQVLDLLNLMYQREK